MQDAWVVDQQSEGTMKQIGFEHPTSTVFSYAGDDATDFEATSTVLDKCTGTNGQKWTVDVTVATSTGKATYVASDNCPELTPNFKFIGSSNGS